METKAQAKFIKVAPRKVRLIADLIRGLNVEEALTRLQFARKAAVVPMAKLLKSAVSNAEENHNLKRSNLYIKELKVNEGTVLKRWMPRAMGRATPLRKRSSHIMMVLGERVATSPEAAVKGKAPVKSDLIKIDEFDDLRDAAAGKEKGEKEKVDGGKKAAASKKGFATKVLNRRTGQK